MAPSRLDYPSTVGQVVSIPEPLWSSPSSGKFGNRSGNPSFRIKNTSSRKLETGHLFESEAKNAEGMIRTGTFMTSDAKATDILVDDF